MKKNIQIPYRDQLLELGKLYKIDSMRRNIQEISLKNIQNKGVGVIDVFRL